MSTAAKVSVYRCAECSHGRDLMAWAPANAYGPVGADGDLRAHYDVWDDGIHEDSIQCATHPDGVIERCFKGTWCRWWRCPWCLGEARSCPAGGFHPADKPPRSGSDPGRAHEGWRPIADIDRLPTSPDAGPGHAFNLTAGRPWMLARCRVCGSSIASPLGREACRGDRHACPVILEGPAPDARQMWGRNDWFCYQPGHMSADFTAWTCEAGHVITRDSHEHLSRRCAIPDGCPRADLTSTGEQA